LVVANVICDLAGKDDSRVHSIGGSHMQFWLKYCSAVLLHSASTDPQALHTVHIPFFSIPSTPRSYTATAITYHTHKHQQRCEYLQETLSPHAHAATKTHLYTSRPHFHNVQHHQAHLPPHRPPGPRRYLKLVPRLHHTPLRPLRQPPRCPHKHHHSCVRAHLPPFVPDGVVRAEYELS
jgi:hypothetical protein